MIHQEYVIYQTVYDPSGICDLSNCARHASGISIIRYVQSKNTGRPNISEVFKKKVFWIKKTKVGKSTFDRSHIPDGS
jgi:hypothetical protein